jgi:serine/threonine protein kinase
VLSDRFLITQHSALITHYSPTKVDSRVDQNTFLEQLGQSGLLSDAQIADLRVRFVSSSPEGLSSALVQEGILTSFQVKKLHSGQTKGLVLGQYRILDELGRGGYGCVFKARHNLMDRVVALKVIAPELVEDPKARSWFRREVLAATHLNHPNIVLAYDADEVDEVLFFAMEFVDGPNLEAMVRQQGPVPIALACELMQQAAKALQYAHEKGMVHRDIKPANLLIPRGAAAEALAAGKTKLFRAGTSTVLVKVVDFGLARLQSSSNQNTLVLHNEKSFIGTPAYVSPEQARNIHEVDIRSDLYSLGCTFYYALTGSQPYEASSPVQLLVQHLEREPEPLGKRRPEIPPALASIVRRLMAKKPEQRFQTPAELLSELGFFYGMEWSAPNLTMPALGAEPKPQSTSDFSLAGAGPAFSEIHASDAQEYRDLNPTRITAEPIQENAVRRAKVSSSTLPRIPSIPSSEKSHGQGELEVGGPAAPSTDTDTVTYKALGTSRAPANPGMQDPAGIPIRADAESLKVGASLIQAWREWTEVVEQSMASRHSGFNELGYGDLYRRLMVACEAHTLGANQAERTLFRRMAEVLKPWLTLQSLASTDRETLASLCRRCKQIDGELGLVKKNWWPWTVALIVLVASGGLGWLLIQDSSRSRFLDIPTFASWWSFLEKKDPVVCLAVLLPLVVGVSLFLLKRFLRS